MINKRLLIGVLFALSLVVLPQSRGDSLSDVSAQSVVMGEPTAKSLGDFRKALIATAEKACKDKEITRGDLFRLRIASMHKPTLEKMHQSCAEQVLSDGQSQSYGAIDWSKLAAFIKEMIPIILELIKLFADNGHYQTQFICYQDFHSVPIATGHVWSNNLRLAA